MSTRLSRWLAAAALAVCVIGVGTVFYRHQAPGPDSASGEAAATAAPTITDTQPAPPADGRDALSSAGQSVPRPQVRVSAFMPQLQEAARGGDGSAACTLAFELSGCLEMQRMELADHAAGGLQDSPDMPLSTLANHRRRCSAATDADLQDRYRYQAQAFASGNPAAERWYVQSPLLSEEDFLTNSPNAIDFRRRAPAYVARALQRRNIEDLKLLLQIYTPPGYGHVVSRLRIRDDAMFLALADAAERAEVDDEQAKPLAAYLRHKVGADVLTRVTRRASQIAGPWGGAGARETEAPNGSFGPDSCAPIKR